MHTIQLNNGVEMPLLGYGLFKVPPQEAERCTADALEVGYRLIDTAQAYDNEKGVGDAIAKSGIRREDIFLVTKIWITNAGEEKAAKSIDESLRKLQTDYVDLLLIHQAYGDVFGSWRAMEKAYRTGTARAIGVSNFQAGRFYQGSSYNFRIEKEIQRNIEAKSIGTPYGYNFYNMSPRSSCTRVITNNGTSGASEDLDFISSLKAIYNTSGKAIFEP